MQGKIELRAIKVDFLQGNSAFEAIVSRFGAGKFSGYEQGNEVSLQGNGFVRIANILQFQAGEAGLN